jgi:D-glycero-alpha-D-manno-heptose-7-phosphate kinase
MIISRTPLRISFVGGGSDLPAFYQQEAGAVVSTAINKYIYITVNPKFDDQIRASYSRTEIVSHVDEVKHELIREALKMVRIDRGIEITSISDIPSKGTGLGSSSTYTVGLLNALYAYRNYFAGAERLAREACTIEIERCSKPIGKQDQYIAAYGGFKFIRFNSDGSVFVDPVVCAPETRERLQEGLLMLYTGLVRNADDILCQQSHNTQADEEKRAGLRWMVDLAEQMREALLCTCIDEWYERARAHGAIGGKILGAGGGGFMLLYAPSERHPEICEALPELRPIDFRFSQEGSKLIYVEENGYG